MISVTGIDDVNARFQEAMRDIGVSRTQRVIKEVLDDVVLNATELTPRDTGFLYNSSYTQVWQTTSGWQGQVGYGALYAPYVHDAPGTLMGTGLAWNPDAEPEFLRKGLEETINYNLDAIIQNQYTI